VPYVIVVLSTIAVVYTTLGGLRPVMVTDVIQFLVLVSGIVLTISFSDS
jgi:Na+/proline symporter